MTFDVIVVGAGAAGLMCALEAGKRRRRVAVLERNGIPGRKIHISGGGRCNFTNSHTTPDNFLTSNPQFPRSALARFTPADFVRMMESHRIPYHEKKLGQLFCDRTSADVVGMLLRECDEAGVKIYCGCSVAQIHRKDAFTLATSAGEFRGQSLVVASGGLSIPSLGATGLGYDIARQFGLSVISPAPALVPLTFTGPEGRLFESLSGVSLDATVQSEKVRFREKVLFTHRGLSGPAILQISSYWKPGSNISLDILPGIEIQRCGADLATVLQGYLPKRFACAWCDVYAPARPLAQYTRKEFDDITRQLHAWQLRPSDTEGYRKAEVTAGGVDTRELSSQTMAAQSVENLYFIGEVVDVTGQLGGFNFQWAWASGFAAGQYA